MAANRLKLLRWITGLAAVFLLAATLVLFVRATQIQESGIVAHVTRSQAAPFLRDQPGNNGTVITVLEYGSLVRIKDSTTTSNTDWYYVETEESSGWLLATLLSFNPPQTTNQE